MEPSAPSSVDRNGLEEIATRVRACTRCPLHEGRTHAVPGEGAGLDGSPQGALAESGPGRFGVAGATAQARLDLGRRTLSGEVSANQKTQQAEFSGVMLVGEAPGRNEDETGRPFCGAAGRNLDLALATAGLPRESVFVTSIVKCRPPGNRDPKPEEKASCLPYLEGQVAALRPRVLVALGRHGLSGLVDDVPAKFSDVRGTFLEGRFGVPVWVSLHPAAVIYRQVWKQQYLDDWRRFGEWVRTGAWPGE